MGFEGMPQSGGIDERIKIAERTVRMAPKGGGQWRTASERLDKVKEEKQLREAAAEEAEKALDDLEMVG